MTEALLAERLRIRGWPAIVAWSLVFPVTHLSAIIGGQGSVVFAHINTIVVGGLVVALALWINSWHFPKLEHVISHPETVISDLTGRSVGSPAWLWTATGSSHSQYPHRGSSRRGDVAAVSAWIPVIVATFLFDWQAGTIFNYGFAPVAPPWGISSWISNRTGWAYFALTGLSLFFRYAAHWRLLAKWVKGTGPEKLPESANREEWEKWEGEWRVYCQGLKATSAIFFKGFAAMLLIVAVYTWTWIVYFRQGAGLQPGLIVILTFAVASIPIYILGPSWAAWRRVQDTQEELRKTASKMISKSEEIRPGELGGFPSIVSLILSWSNESHFSMRQGSPEAAMITIGSFLTQSLVAVAGAIAGFGT